MWNVTIDGEVNDPYEKPIEDTKNMLMCCYFNVGIEAAVGYNFETMRTRTKCCNKFIYTIQAIKIAMFNIRA